MPRDARLALWEGSRTAVSADGAIQALWRGLAIYAPTTEKPHHSAVGWCHRAAQAFGSIGGCFVSVLPCLLSGLTGCKRNRLADRIAYALPAEARHTLAEWAVLEKSMRWHFLPCTKRSESSNTWRRLNELLAFRACVAIFLCGGMAGYRYPHSPDSDPLPDMHEAPRVHGAAFRR